MLEKNSILRLEIKIKALLAEIDVDKQEIRYHK